MPRTQHFLLPVLLLACGAPGREPRAGDGDGRSAPDRIPAAESAAIAGTGAPPRPDALPESLAASVPESAWVTVDSLTLIGFYPIRTNEQLDADEDLATVLDDFSFHLGTAMDSLRARGVAVHLRGGDTLWLRARDARWRWVRPADSADVGYVLVDPARRLTALYGVRTWLDLPADVDAFRRGATPIP